MTYHPPQAVLLVDGYNMIGAWVNLKRMLEREGMAAARQELSEALINYSAFQGYETQIVFDAYDRDIPQQLEVLTPHVSLCYTNYGETADTYIEKTCAAFRYDSRKFERRLIVATSDYTQQQVVQGYGATCWSAEQLRASIEAILHQVKQRQAQRSPNRRLASRLNPAAQQRLAQLRLGLPPSPPV